MDWKDRKNPPVDYMNKEVTVKVVENGPVRVALQVTQKRDEFGDQPDNQPVSRRCRQIN